MGPDMVCDSIIKVAVMAVKEEVLWVGLASSTGLIEETRCPTIITTSWRPATRAHTNMSFSHIHKVRTNVLQRYSINYLVEIYVPSLLRPTKSLFLTFLV